MQFKDRAEKIGSIVACGLMAGVAVILIIAGQIFLGASLGLLLWCVIADPFGFDDRAKIKGELERIRRQQEEQRKEQETLERAHSLLVRYARRMWPGLTDFMLEELAEEARQKTACSAEMKQH